MQTLWQDLRYGARMLMKQPGFTLIAVLSLALGIGANTAIFSLVNTVLLRTLPVARPQQIRAVNMTMASGADYVVTSYPNYRDLRDRNDVLAGLIAYRPVAMSLSHQGANERLFGLLATGNYFDVLGVQAVQGRMFMQEDDRTPGAHPVAVMSYQIWQSRFGGDPAIVGKNVLLNGLSFTVLGVAPQGFHGADAVIAPAFWTPMMMQRQIEPDSDYLEERGDGRLFMAGRLKEGVSEAQAEAALNNAMAQLARDYPQVNEGRAIELNPPGLISPQFRTPFVGFAAVLFVVVGLVLLIACTNLANLLLARATGRRREIAVRLALGARRWQLVRQLLTESILLALLGGVIGLLAAAWVNDLVMAVRPPFDFPVRIDLSVDWRVASFALALSFLTGIVFGLLPAWQSTKPDLIAALKDENAVAGYRRAHLRNALVVAQVALSLVLLIGAGLIVRSLQQAQSLNPGFNADQAVTLGFDLSLQGYDEARGRAFQQLTLERVRALPGVTAAALADFMPLSLNESSTSVYIEGKTAPNLASLPDTLYCHVGTDYFRAMGIPLRAGREFTPQERDRESRVAIVNETFARRFWPNENAVGRQFKFGGADGPAWQIVGVAQDGKYVSLGETPRLIVYQPLLRDYSSSVKLIARTSGDAATSLATLRREVQSLDAALPLYGVKTLREHLSLPLFPARVAATILSAFGLLALALAAIGIYGVMSFSVAQRTREIGIRMALGARRRDVLSLIVRQGMFTTLMGIALGLSGALSVTRFLANLLFSVSATDPLTFVVIIGLLASVALLACFIPARRATRVDPLVALRCE